jgi:hypothetical protein
MPFPFKRDPRQDLEDLWRVERRDRGARDVGLSSVTAGEGSLELRTAGGDAVAHLGDLPGDDFGIGIPDGGPIVTIQQYIASRISALQSTLADLAAALETVQGELSGLAADLGELQSGAASQASLIQNLRDRIEIAEEALVDHNAALGNHAARIGSLESSDLLNQAQIQVLRTFLNQKFPDDPPPPWAW